MLRAADSVKSASGRHRIPQGSDRIFHGVQPLATQVTIAPTSQGRDKHANFLVLARTYVSPEWLS